MRTVPSLNTQRLNRASKARTRNSINKRRPLRIESLESRRVLATYIVDTFTDSATGICGIDGVGNDSCSLRSAILAANARPGLDTVSLPPGTYPMSTVTAGLSRFNITDSINIEGNTLDAAAVVIDGMQNDRMLDTFLGVGSVTLKNLTLTNGKTLDTDVGPTGAGVRVQRGTDLTLDNVRMTNHEADFGAALAFFGTTLTINNSVFENNISTDDSFYGAIQIFDNAGIGSVTTITDSLFNQNTGGAIGANGSSSVRIDVTIESSEFTGNTKTIGGGAALTFSDANVTLSGVTVENNSTQAPSADGGGIRILSTTLNATGIFINNNQTPRQGGGLYATRSEVNLLSGEINGNRSGLEGGGVYIDSSGSPQPVSLRGLTIMDNSAALSGGGAYIVGMGDINFLGNSISNNESMESGGGVYLLDNLASTFESVVFESNSSVTGGGGAAILNDATFKDAIFRQNSVTGTGIQDPFRFDLGGGAIAIAQNAGVRPTIRIEDSSILENSAALAGGIGSANANLVIVDSTIEDNRSTGTLGGAGGIGFAQDDVQGITANRVRMTINNSTVSNNRSNAEAGGIGVADADITLNNTAISGNTATGGRGGGIGAIGLNNSPVVRLNRTTLDNNSASSDGGAIAVVDAGFFISNTTVSDNTAAGNGGGIAYANTDTSVSGGIEFSTIVSNTAQFGSNVAVNGSVTRFLSSIVSDPRGNAPIINIISGGPGEVSSQGFNIFSNTNFSNPAATDLLGVDPLLGPLSDNGGAGKTRALLPRSPAIDSGANAPLVVDGRGSLRPVDGDGNGVARNDIGAFELESGAATTFSISGLVFVDANNNGLDDNDQRLTDVSVDLFRDTGDGVFGSDDVLVDSTITSFSPDFGGYSFFDLTPGQYFVVQGATSDPPDLINPAPVSVLLTTDTPVNLANLVPSFSAVPDSVRVAEDTPIDISVLANDNAGSGTLRILSTTMPSNGSVSIVGNQVRYTPASDFFGTDSFTYTITNAPVGSTGSTLTAAVSINVTPENDAPVATDDTLSTTNQAPLVIGFATLTANDNAGPSNEPQGLTVTAVTQPASGSAVLNASGIVFTPAPGFVGSTSFNYTVRDTEGLTDTATVTVNVSSASGTADLQSSLSSPVAVRQGDTFTYFGSVFNAGPSDASSVVATLALPQGLTVVSTNGPSGPGTVTGQSVRFNIPQIANRSSASLTVTVVASSTAAGPSTPATLTVSSATPDPVVTNNVDSQTTVVTSIHRLTTGTGDAHVTIDVDSTGAFGTDGTGIGGLRSLYDPVGTIAAADTVFDSRLGIRSGNSTYDSVRSIDSNVSVLAQVAGSTTSATSRFAVGPYVVSLVQTVSSTFSASGIRTGAELTQTYAIQNSSNVPQNLGIVRYIDADLLFDGSIDDGGGALIGPDGNMILFETDKGGSGSADTTFVGITNAGGAPVTSGFFEIDEFSALRDRLFRSGDATLDDSISRDADNDGFVDATREYDVELALANRFPGLAPGATATFVTKTIFGNQPTSVAPSQTANLTGQVGCDVDGDGVVEANEVSSGVTVFVDLNGNRMLDSGEPRTVTDSTGTYNLSRLNVSAGQTATVIVQNPPSCFAAAPDIGVTREALNTGSLSRGVTATDINRDGAIDLLVANELGNNVSVLLNNPVAEGSFSSATPISLNKRPVAITSWQAPGARFPVVAVAAVGSNANRGSIFVMDGGLSASPKEFTMGDGPIAVAINDFNGDNQADFVTASYRSGTIVARMSGVSGERVIATSRSPKSVTAADVNGDSNVDIVIGSYGFDGDNSSEVIVLLGDGRGGFTPNRQTISRRGAIDVAVGNFDGDSADEIVVAGYDGDVRIFNFANGSLQPIATVTTEVGIESIAVRDINDDGLTDLVIANSRAETVELFMNQSGAFVRNRTITGVPSPSDVVIARLDADDVLDVAVSNLYGSVGPTYTLPSKVTVLGLTISEREVTLTANQTLTENFKFVPNPRTTEAMRKEAARDRDVDRNGTVTPRDALIVVNSISRSANAPEGEQSRRKNRYRLDVNDDGKVTAVDALRVINFIALQTHQNLAEGELWSAPQDDERVKREAATDAAMSSISELF